MHRLWLLFVVLSLTGCNREDKVLLEATSPDGFWTVQHVDRSRGICCSDGVVIRDRHGAVVEEYKLGTHDDSIDYPDYTDIYFTDEEAWMGDGSRLTGDLNWQESYIPVSRPKGIPRE